MRDWLDRVLTLSGPLSYALVGLLVFAEDALFIGFLVPGETAAILGGVAASIGHVSLTAITIVVIAAAILGDSVAYQVGRWLGPRLLQSRPLHKRRDRLRRAQGQLARNGGSAVFLGRFVTFLHAVMPALAGAAHMPYSRFLVANAVGGLVWGAGMVLLGFLAGRSYEVVAKRAGTTTALVVAVIVVATVIILQIRKARRWADEVPNETGADDD